MVDMKLSALKKVFEKIRNMSDEEFEKEFEKHRNGDIARTLYYLWTGEELPDKEEK